MTPAVMKKTPDPYSRCGLQLNLAALRAMIIRKDLGKKPAVEIRDGIFTQAIFVGRPTGEWFCNPIGLCRNAVHDPGVFGLAEARYGVGDRRVCGDYAYSRSRAAIAARPGSQATARLVEVLATQKAKESCDATVLETPARAEQEQALRSQGSGAATAIYVCRCAAQADRAVVASGSCPPCGGPI